MIDATMTINAKCNLEIIKDFYLTDFKHVEINSYKDLQNLIEEIIPDKIEKAMIEDATLRIYFK